MSHELSLRGEFLPQVVWQQIEEVSARLIKSQALPSTIANASQLTMVLMAGYEAGMKPMESLNAYYIVNGRLTIYGDAVIRQLKRADYKVKWGEVNDKSATVTIISKDGEEQTETYTMEDAKAAGVLNKVPWKNHPKDMMRWKAIARAVRFFCPEVLGGVQYFKEEAEDMEPVKQNVIDAVASDSPVPMSAETKARLTELIDLTGATWEDANGWSMGQFQRRIEDLTEDQAKSAISVLEKKAELQGLMKPTELEATTSASDSADEPAAT